MIQKNRAWFWVLSLSLITLPALAGTRIESLYVPGPNLDLKARWLVPSSRMSSDRARANLMVAESTFTEIVFNIPSEFVGKNVKIFMIMPPQTVGMVGSTGLEVEWRTQGVLLPGKLQANEKVLFFEGVIPKSPLRDWIAYTFRMDARYTLGDVRFDPVYEIELR